MRPNENLFHMWVLVSYGELYCLLSVERQQKWASHKCHASVIEKWKSVPTAHSWAHEVKLEAGSVAQVLRKWGADTPGGALYTLCALCKRSRCNICDERMCATGHRSIWPTNYSLTKTQQGLTPLRHHLAPLWNPPSPPCTISPPLFYWRLAPLDYIANMSQQQSITPVTYM